MFSLFTCPGQFWNIPIQIASYQGDFNFRVNSPSDYYTVTVSHPHSEPRSFVGSLYHISWDLEEKQCLYVGNSQGGPSSETNDYDDSVIEGSYKDYVTRDLFETSFKYSVFNHIDLCK